MRARAAMGAMAAASLALGLSAVAAGPAQAGATCGTPVFDPDLDAVVHTCEVVGSDAVRVQYVFNCGLLGGGERTSTKTWTVSQTALISHPCDGSPWGVSFSIA